MRIYHNIPAIAAYNSLSKIVGGLEKSLSKLSTGLRVRGAADDAAGLAISEKMRVQITGLDVAGRNAQDGISLIQTADGALQETTSMLMRMRELAIQGANDTMTQQDRRYLQLEIEQLKDDINRIATTTIFNKKRLLDGSSSVLWSSDDLNTRLFVRGGLRQIDQFGQKNVLEGNYKITINANPGAAEIQKSDIFKIKHKNVISDLALNKELFAEGVQIDGLPAGNYSIQVIERNFDIANLSVDQTFGLSAAFELATDWSTLQDMSGTANILFEVTNVDTSSRTLTMKATALLTTITGESKSFVQEGITISTSVGFTWTAFGIGGNILCAVTTAALAQSAVGSKAVVLVLGATDIEILAISGTQDANWGGYWGNGGLRDSYFLFDGDSVSEMDVAMRGFYLNTANGSVYESNITLKVGNIKDSPKGDFLTGTIASFKATYIGQTARLDTQLRDLDKFWNSEGRFLLDNPSRIEITQGDGTGTRITLYATDTIQDVQTKLNAAYELGLNQQYYLDNSVQNDSGKFVTFVTNATRNTSEAVAGTVVLRSVVNGMTGTVRLSGDEDIIKALSLNIIQEARENQFFVSIQDAHSGETIVSNQKISGNLAVGLLHPNLDFEFRSDADMSTAWNDVSKKYDTRGKDSSTYETIIHIADNSIVFQIGANESEDMGVDIGDMTTRAIGIHRVLVTDIGSAQRSITMVDAALDKISSQRARLGAYQNRLEHTITNLSVAAENLTAAESRIRDLDIAREMMHYTKTNILLRSGNAMLSQANQLPQSVMELLR